MIFSILNEFGACVAVLEVPNEESAALNCPEGCSLYEGAARPGEDYLKGGVMRQFPPRPGPWAVFDFALEQWTDPRTEADLAAETAQLFAGLRVERDARLAACDWTQVPDVPISTAQRDAWRDYRQALRDLPEMTLDPAAPAWPMPPAE